MTDLNTSRSASQILAEGMTAVEGWEIAEVGSREEWEAGEQATRCLAELDVVLRDGSHLTDDRLAAIKRLVETPAEYGANHSAAQSALASAVPELLDEIARLRIFPAQ